MPSDLELNWGQQSGPLNHSSHRLRLTCDSSVPFAGLFKELWEFRYFDSEGNNIASVYVKETPLKSGKWYAFFDSKGMFGWLSDWFNDSEVPVRIWRHISKRTIVGDTCGKHMLVGQRRWWIEDDGASTVLVKTESYDYARGLVNRLGSLLGVRLQRHVWINYFKNIRHAYETKGILRNGAIMKNELQQREKLLGGIASEQKWLGNKTSPWQPKKPYPGKEME